MSDHETELGQLIERRLSRRSLLKGLSMVAAGAALPLREAAAAERSSLGFSALPLTFDTTHHVAPGYRADRLISWGDPVLATAPKYDFTAQSAARQAGQFGYNNDFTAYLPLDGSRRGLLCVNHEYTDPQLMFPGMDRKNAVDKVTEAQARTEMEAHGHTIVEVVKTKRGWTTNPEGKLNRRITATTPCAVAGPAAGHRRMKTPDDPTGRRVIGTFANCSGGTTPWGTVLTAEENIDFYFINTPKTEQKNHERYGIAKLTLFAWHKWERRFRLDEAPNEPNRHGWLVEIDPRDPTAAPVKRTALGRFAHESGTVTLNYDNRVVVYSGDDKRFEYLYRYVSNHAYDPAKPERNKTLLNEGVLSVAKFHDDGTVEWLPLVHGRGPLVAKNGFSDQGDVVIEARRAADLVGATQMDRPEDVGVEETTGRVYVALTNNDRRETPNAANPRKKNNHGHIVELTVPRRNGGFDHASPMVGWGLFLLGQDPTDKATPRAKYIAAAAPPSTALGLLALGANRNGVDKLLDDGERLLGKKRGEVGGHFTEDGVLSCPDNFAFDPSGRLWITTDGQDKVGVADSIYATDTSGPGRAKARRFFNAPRGAEVSGPSFTPDGKTLFLCVQHPAQERTSTFDAPSTRWPDFVDGAPPRPSVMAIEREDGGEVGS